MKLTSSTRIHTLVEAHPFLLDFLVGYNPKFKLLKNKAMRATMGRVATLGKVASIGGVPLDRLIEDIAAAIERETGERMEVDLSAAADDRANVDELREIIKSLHLGEPFEKVKKRFDLLMSEIEPLQIANMEEQLIREGMPAGEIQRLCDLHVSVFRDALDSRDGVSTPPGHPVHTYMAENTRFTGLVNEFDGLVQRLADDQSPVFMNAVRDELAEKIDALSKLGIHYVRKENQLFPYLEKHGVTGPSQVMWGIHDEIRAQIGDVRNAVEAGDAERIVDIGPKLSRAVVEMIYKENSILFPMAMEAVSEDEWREIRKGEDEVGYAFVEPGSGWPEEGGASAESVSARAGGEIDLDTGALTREQIDLMLRHLPVEVSFVDENDEVRYYSGHRNRIFPRSPGVIGRKVRNCHPPKSVDVVERILGAFRSGERDKADFWIGMDGRTIMISYFAVRDEGGVYRGTIEVTRDVTAIRGIEGERRLLDWDGPGSE
ncbi:MAG: DUF438 domain-containing protein [Candidatus Latescibacteria bacterium]|nr:DUF438 domain-containing protein [Candidatus Latescibacterota bacterium]